MENNDTNNQECNCSDDCCTDSKNKIWKQIAFVFVVLAALSIIAMKLANDYCGREPSVNSDTIMPAKSACCDSTAHKCFDRKWNPGSDNPCCSQTKK